MRHAAIQLSRACLPGPAEVPAEPFGNKCQPVLRLELLPGLAEHAMQLVDALAQQRVGHQGPVHGRADEARGQLGQVEIDDPLAEARGRGGTPVVRDMRR